MARSVSEERRIISDYLEAFGEPPRANVGGIALMVDADNTQSEARAVSDDLAMVTIESKAAREVCAG